MLVLVMTNKTNGEGDFEHTRLSLMLSGLMREHWLHEDWQLFHLSHKNVFSYGSHIILPVKEEIRWIVS